MAHDDDLVALLDRLASLEYERGRIRAQLEFHLRLRHVAHDTPAPVAEARGRPPGSVTRYRGALSGRIIEELAKCDNLSNVELTHLIGANSESVRQAIKRLITEGRVRRTEKFKFALVRDREAPSA